MRLVGSYQVQKNSVFPVWKGELVKPYYFVDRKFKHFTGTENFAIVPANLKEPYILNALVPVEHRDNLLLWIQPASHEQMMVCRSLCENCMVLQVGLWGAIAILVAQEHLPASVTFISKDRTTFEKYTLEKGQITKTEFPAEQQPKSQSSAVKSGARSSTAAAKGQ